MLNHLCSQMGDIQLWTRPVMPQGSMAFAFVNTGTGGTPTKVSISLQNLGMTMSGGYNITELFDNKNMGEFKPSQTFMTMVNPTGIFLAKAVPLSGY